MAHQFGYSGYLSPFSDRYGSEDMRTIWSEMYKRSLWRRLWVILAEAQNQVGLVTAEQLEDLRTHQEDVDLERANAIEKDIQHDLMAELRTFAEQCHIGGSILHLGATSMDIEDNADALRLREALTLIIVEMRHLLEELANLIEHWAEIPTMGFTHLQPAEPTTIGYRLAQYGQDLLIDLQQLEYTRSNIRGKGFRGAVGTSATFVELLRTHVAAASSESGTTDAAKMTSIEAYFTNALHLPTFSVTTQTYPRKQDWLVINALAGVAGSLSKFAFDLRILQSPGFGEWAEPSAAKQVSSSAMPFKRNPVNAETINSLARLVATIPRIAWDNAAHSLFERTLDDGANRREILPTAFLAVDEIVRRALYIISSLHIDREAAQHSLSRYELFASTERLLMACVQAGGDRQLLHEVLREHVAVARSEMEAGRSNPLRDLLTADGRITALIPSERLPDFLNLSAYVGNAPELARQLATQIRSSLAKNP